MAIVRGELKCLSCSRILALVEGETGGTMMLKVDGRWPQGVLRRGAAFVCGRCGGRAFLENLEEIPRAA